MPIFTIKHITTYHYRQPVAFGEHRMMLRPRDDGDQRVLVSDTRHHARAERACLDAGHLRQSCGDRPILGPRHGASLRKHHSSSITRRPIFRTADIEDYAQSYPFAYAANDKPDLARFIAPPSSDPEVDRWATCFLRDDGTADTHELLVGMTQTIRRTFRHVARHEKGIREPIQTLELASGSCRDLAMLMIAGLRSLGIAARFVSGYLHLADDDDDRLTGGNTHAWVQVYVPGPAGSISIRRAAWSGIRTSCVSRSCMSRARRSRWRAH